jgi:xanthine dehydrogenase small subunit
LLNVAQLQQIPECLLIRFLLGQREQTVISINPNMSVLDYLREQLKRTGTKEGCGTGDCGACTVVLAEVDPADSNGSRLRYRTVNACITNLGALHGRQLITVEDLKHEGKLHPVQQVMVDNHGTQCGFCSPGFIMSLFAHFKSHLPGDRATVMESLGGNLCRCTGYRPILDSAREMDRYPREDQFSAARDATVSQLQTLGQQPCAVELTDGAKRYFAPRSIDELCVLLAEYPGATLIAGGTDLYPALTQSLSEMDVMIAITGVPELRQFSDSGPALEIGAAASLSDLAQPLLRYYSELDEMLKRFGSRQIRNQGTLGGHVANASPVGDLLPFLIAVSANLKLRSGGQVRNLKVEDFFLEHRKTALQQGEFIESVLVPMPTSDSLLRVYKVSKRLYEDISITCAAFRLHLAQGVVSDASIVFGGLDEIPRRARVCEQAMLLKPWCQETIEAAMAALAEDFTPISDFRASAEYRMQASCNLLQRFFLDTPDRTDHIRVTEYA